MTQSRWERSAGPPGPFVAPTEGSMVVIAYHPISLAIDEPVVVTIAEWFSERLVVGFSAGVVVSHRLSFMKHQVNIINHQLTIINHYSPSTYHY